VELVRLCIFVSSILFRLEGGVDSRGMIYPNTADYVARNCISPIIRNPLTTMIYTTMVFGLAGELYLVGWEGKPPPGTPSPWLLGVKSAFIK